MNWSLTITGDEFEVKGILGKLTKVLNDQMESQQYDSKYDPLRDYLAQKTDTEKTTLELTLDEIQGIIGKDLPNSAYEYDAFWRDRTRGIGKSIIEAGWQIGTLERDESSKIRKVNLQVFAGMGTLKEMENNAIISALEESGGNRAEAAKLLGMSLRSLHYKLKNQVDGG